MLSMHSVRNEMNEAMREEGKWFRADSILSHVLLIILLSLMVGVQEA
jgi:hypothetical protein